MIGKACLDLIEDRLRQAPTLFLNRRATSLVITPNLPVGYPETFPITVYDEGDECMVAALRWHTHFNDPEEACQSVCWLLTPYNRLVEEYKGALYVSGWVEHYTDQGWMRVCPVFYLNPDHPPDWVAGPNEEYQLVIYQQAVLSPPAPFTSYFPNAILEEETLLPVGSILGKSHEASSGPLGPSIES
ncbi:MAG: hypothetical protein JNK63_10605 [Chthonomonas sp.]|nr:hypothetical protein [Chthonomonas sp.]